MLSPTSSATALGVTFAVRAAHRARSGLVLGLGLAVLADQLPARHRLLPHVFSSTVATSVAVASLMWLVLLNPSIGVLTNILPFDGAEDPGPARTDPTRRCSPSAVTTIWQNSGFTFIVITRRPAVHPDELYESACIDGAGRGGASPT